MSDIVIGLPPETRWQRFKRSVGKIHPIVQAAVVAGIFSLLGLWLGSALESARLQSEVSDLEKAVKARDTTIRDKTADIQRLEHFLLLSAPSPWSGMLVQKEKHCASL